MNATTWRNMKETKVTCETCKQWIGRLPNVIGNSLKSEAVAKDAGWFKIYCHSQNSKKGRSIWYCPVCAKKTTVKQMVDSV